MGFLDGLFGTKVTNPVLAAALQAYTRDASDENLVDLWQKLLKAKILVATTTDGKNAFGKIKQIRDAVSITFITKQGERSDVVLCIYLDNATADKYAPNAPHIALTGDQAYALATAKGLNGLMLCTTEDQPCEIRCWQHSVFIDKVGDANKLQGMATKFTRAGSHADAEGILKSALAVAQRDPGPQHPFTAELNLELARAMRSQNKLTEAEWIYRRALSIYEISGSHDLDVASVSEALGTLYIENKKTAMAAPLLTRAVDIYESIPGAKPDAIGRILCQLAELKRDEKNIAEAENFYKRATIALEERKHPDVLQVLNKQGSLCEGEQRLKDALTLYLRTLSIADSVKRTRDYDVSYAAFRAAAIHLSDDQVAEAEPLANKALEGFRKEGSRADVEAVETLLRTIREKAEAQEIARKEEEENKANKPRFGAGSKRPADLPLLDMSELRSNPKATFVGKNAPPPKEEEEKPSDSEEAALAEMRDFLNNVDKPKSKASDTETKIPAISQTQAMRVEETVAAVNEAVATDEDSVDVDELFASTKKAVADRKEEQKKKDDDENPASASAPEVVQEPEKKLFENPVDNDVSMIFNKSIVNNDADRYDKPISERTKVDPESNIPAPPPKPAPPQSDRYDTPISERKAAAEAKSLEAQTVDEPAAEVAGEPQATVEPTEAAEASEAPVAEEKKGLFDMKVAGEISYIFNSSMMGGGPTKSDRFDVPIGERIKQAAEQEAMQQEKDAAEAAAAEAAAAEAAAAEAAAAEAAAAEAAAAEAAAAEPAAAEAAEAEAAEARAAEEAAAAAKAAAAAAKAAAAAAQANAEQEEHSNLVTARTESDDANIDNLFDDQNTLFDDKELDGSLDDAFASILADPTALNDRIEKPLQSMKLPEKPFDERYDVPISERMKAFKPADAEPVAEPEQPVETKAAQEPALTLNNLLSEELPKASDDAAEEEQEEQPKAEEKPAEPAPEPAVVSKVDETELAQAKTPEELIRLLESKLQDEPNNSELWLRKGTALIQQQRLDEAIKVFDKVTTMSPNDAKAWYCKGSSLHLKNRFEDALYCFNHVLNLDQDNSKAMMRKAECLAKLGRPEQGMHVYDRLLLVQPKFVPGWLSKARALLQQRKLEEALECYEAVLALDPSNEDALKAKNLIATKLGATAGK